ncbi:MAG: hypothetical protein JOS17DRAFT_740206 [Linnemannia elongata]|nr:MAG: hypothetical protein JOS17DRAFT_740206 [Linnemannia elongata]
MDGTEMIRRTRVRCTEKHTVVGTTLRWELGMMCAVFVVVGIVGISMCVLHVTDAIRLGEEGFVCRWNVVSVHSCRRWLSGAVDRGASRLFGSADRASTVVKPASWVLLVVVVVDAIVAVVGIAVDTCVMGSVESIDPKDCVLLLHILAMAML